MSSWLTKLARDQICQIRVPGVCNGRTDTTVAAHYRAITLGAGMARKPHDIIAAHGCSACHDVVDNRVPCRQFTRNEVRAMHAEGVLRTIVALIERGSIEVIKS